MTDAAKVGEWEPVPSSNQKFGEWEPSPGYDPKPKNDSGQFPFEDKPIEPVGLFESFIAPVKGYAATTAALGGMEALARKYGAEKAAQLVGQFVPKTGTQLLGGAGVAGTAGVAGELASRKVPEQYKPYARMGAELATGAALAPLSQVGRGPTPAIPRERIESARYLKELGGKPSPQQVSMGPESSAWRHRLTLQQGVANQEYNRAVGLGKIGDVSKSFGKKEFDSAKNSINNEYNSLLSGREVKFDPEFFNNLGRYLNEQQQLTESGITFGQSRSILGALEKIGGIPENLKAQLRGIQGIGEEEATAAESKKALTILNEVVGKLQSEGVIKMPATAYNEIRSILGDAAARTANNRNARLLRKIQGEFDNAANKSMPDIANDLESVRRKYEALKTLEEAQLQSGSEMGIIPAEAVGRAIRNRIEQGAIYGNNNPLRNIGQAGESLGLVSPVKGHRFSQEFTKGLTPHSTLWGALKDIASLPLYPFSKYATARRLEEVPTLPSRLLPSAVATQTNPERK